MGQLTLTMQQHNGIACINEITLTPEGAIKKLEDFLGRQLTQLRIKELFEIGQFVTINVDDKDLKKILNQGYLYAAFEYHANNNGYGIPLVVKSSKSGLIKAVRANHYPEATEYSLFRDCFNGSAFTLDANNIPAGFSGYSFQGLKIS